MNGQNESKSSHDACWCLVTTANRYVSGAGTPPFARCVYYRTIDTTTWNYFSHLSIDVICGVSTKVASLSPSPRNGTWNGSAARSVTGCRETLLPMPAYN